MATRGSVELKKSEVTKEKRRQGQAEWRTRARGESLKDVAWDFIERTVGAWINVH